MIIDGMDAITIAFKNKNKRYPGGDDARFDAVQQQLYPNIKPKFKLEFPCMVFTTGSCFARNIEEALVNYDVVFSTRKSEWSFRANALLNEDKPASMSQRIMQQLKKRLFL